MKTKSIILIAIVAVLLSSCEIPSYIQVYKVTPTKEMIAEDNYLAYEDDNCIVTYDFFALGGNIGFRFYNKTVDKAALRSLVSDCIRLLGNETTAVVLDSLKQLGFHYATQSGISIAMNDIQAPDRAIAGWLDFQALERDGHLE